MLVLVEGDLCKYLAKTQNKSKNYAQPKELDFFRKNSGKKFGESKRMATFAIPFSGEVLWEFSSAGLEHLPYKQRVGGSNPSTPTS